MLSHSIMLFHCKHSILFKDGITRLCCLPGTAYKIFLFTRFYSSNTLMILFLYVPTVITYVACRKQGKIPQNLMADLTGVDF